MFKINLSKFLLSLLIIIICFGVFNTLVFASDPANCDPGELFCNPLKWDSLEELIDNMIGVALLILTPIAVLIFVWTAVKLIRASSAGNEQEITQAKKGLLWAFIGLAILVMTWGIIGIIRDYFIDEGTLGGNCIKDGENYTCLDDLECNTDLHPPVCQKK